MTTPEPNPNPEKKKEFQFSELERKTLTKTLQLLGPDCVSLAAQAGLIESPTETILRTLITENPAMKRVKDLTRKYAPLKYPVLIVGETGTGKEIIAQALHGTRKGEFRGINLTTLPDLLIESELFGHCKGSFTGAIDDKKGLLEFCKNGTIFLDEIGDMPLSAQTKLLRAIQEGKVRPVGSNLEIDINCRFVFATHQKLEKLIMEEKFRLDLFYRINVCIIETVPLRARPEDIGEIIDYWCEKEFPGKGLCLQNGILEKWESNYWPGNIRELHNRFIRYIIEKGMI